MPKLVLTFLLMDVLVRNEYLCIWSPACSGLYCSMHLRNIADLQMCALRGSTLSTST